jgi:DNA-binding beta-propeller fold protein YncE
MKRLLRHGSLALALTACPSFTAPTLSAANKTEVPQDPSPRKPVFDGTNMWVTVLNEGKVYKYDRAAFDGHFLWLSASNGHLERIDTSTGAARTSPPAIAPRQGTVAFDGKYVWVSNDLDGTVRYDPGTGQVRSYFLGAPNAIEGPTSTSGISFDGKYLWINSGGNTSLAQKVDPASGVVVASIDLKRLGCAFLTANAFDGSLLWAVCRESSQIVKIDVKTNQVVETVQIAADAFPHDIAFDGKYMWVSAAGTPYRVYKYFVKL